MIDPTTSRDGCVRLAAEHGVRLGAHPGLREAGHFGRGQAQLDPEELELLLLHQVGALEKVAQRYGVRLHHIKLHGALYHASESDPRLGRGYVETVARWWPQMTIYARAGGAVARWASQRGMKVWPEAFADRMYLSDGTLVPRERPRAVLTNTDQVVAQASSIAQRGEVVSADGTKVRLLARTLCLHSDTTGSVRLAPLVRSVL